MFGRRLPPPWRSQKLWRLFIETGIGYMCDDRERGKKIIKMSKDYKAVDESSPMASVDYSKIMARVEDTLQDSPKLLLGFVALSRKRIIPTPPEASVSPPPPVLTMAEAYSFLDSVEEAYEFIEILLTPPHRADEASAVAEKLDQLMKDHQHLLQRFRVFLSAEPKRTIPPESVAPPCNNKRKRAKPVGVRKSQRLLLRSKKSL